ncbi:MAG TPA: hypothetical protein VLB83_00650 [Candidatus Paceibacterota bacterium]|nr:hypothetical protein [Candidatus Paceibacterota bacterium]
MDVIAFHAAWWLLPILVVVFAVLFLRYGGIGGETVAFVLAVVAVAITIEHYLPDEPLPEPACQQTEQTPQKGAFFHSEENFSS